MQHRLNDVVADSGIQDGSYMQSLTSSFSNHLTASRSDNTCKSYSNGFKKWQSFITAQGHCALPAHPVHVALSAWPRSGDPFILNDVI